MDVITYNEIPEVKLVTSSYLLPIISERLEFRNWQRLGKYIALHLCTVDFFQKFQLCRVFYSLSDSFHTKFMAKLDN